MYRIFFFLCFSCLIFGGFVLAASEETLSAEELYLKKQYETAVKEFQKQLEKDPRSTRVNSNLACTMFQLGRQEEALKYWQLALENSPDPTHSGRISYNIGNHYFKANQLDKAIESYKTALRFNPDDKLAKYNLEVAIKQKQPPPPQNNSNSPNNNQNNSDPPPENNNSNPPKSSKQPQMSRDEAERLLNALQKSERGPSRHSSDKEQDAPSSNTGRDW